MTQAALTTMTNVLDTTPSELLQQESTTTCNKQVEELPVTWSILGYAAVALAKIILSVTSIWVNKLDSSAHTAGFVRVKNGQPHQRQQRYG